jgi:cyclophilin family peptidyl-prolyl cis-trans isomerase
MKKIISLAVILIFLLNGCGNMKRIVVFETNKGNFEVELNEERAPVTSANFASYVSEGFYDGTIFHRVMDGFMIQGGGFDVNMKQKSTKPAIKNEAGNGLSNKKYTVAMARTGVVDSATSQFFVNVADNDFLDHKDETVRGFGYAVFGEVIAGFDTIDNISKVNVKANEQGEPSLPVEQVIIIKAFMKK